MKKNQNSIEYCKGCGCRKQAKDMMIYAVALDEYYCDQDCMDRHNRVIRDKAEDGVEI